MKLLLAEDNELNLEIATELLQRMGFVNDRTACAYDFRHKIESISVRGEFT